MNDAGFPLRKWNSNSHSLKDLAKANNDFSKDGNITKILGLKWDTQTDVLSLGLGIFDCESNTKRKIVSKISKIYDLLGLFLPVTIKGHIFYLFRN